MSDHIVRMQYADDGQPNFGNWQEDSIGAVGQYGARVVFTRLGQFRQRVIRIRVSSPRKRDFIAASAVMQPTNG